MRVLSIMAAMAAAGMILSSTALAVPYATGVAVTGNDVAFTLNEDAQNVTVMLDGGGTVQSQRAVRHLPGRKAAPSFLFDPLRS